MAEGRAFEGVPNLRELLAMAQRLGLRVEPVRRTGEVRVYGSDGTRATCNVRRKDGNRKLLSIIRKAEKERE